MAHPKDLIKKHRTALFDWLSFLLSFSLGFVFPDPGSFAASGIFSTFIFWSLLVFITGALLKDAPLRHRFSQKGSKPPEVPFLLFLVLGHWIIMLAALLLAEPAARSLLGLAPAPVSNYTDSPGYWICFVLSFVFTWIVFRSKKRGLITEEYEPRRLAGQEWLADGLLLVGVGCLSFVFWERSLLGMMTSREIRSFSEIWYLFFLLSFAYLLFYLPLRYLFLVEDYRNGRTWQRLMFLFGLLLLRSLIEMLRLG